MATSKTKPTAAEYEKLGRSIESALIDNYINWLGNTRRLIWTSFVRGIFVGLGTVIGATVVVGLLVWILNMVGGGLPGGVGKYLKDTGSQIEQNSP